MSDARQVRAFPPPALTLIGLARFIAFLLRRLHHCVQPPIQKPGAPFAGWQAIRLTHITGPIGLFAQRGSSGLHLS